jgi:Ca2+-binding RTX toxin-like protein
MTVENLPFISLTSNEVYENATNETVVGTIYNYGSSGEVYTYTLLDDAGGRFKLVGDSIVVADGSKLDYESSAFHEISFRATNSAGVTIDMSFMLGVMNVVEAGEKPPVLVGMSEGFVQENAAAGTEVAVFESYSPTETYTFALVDNAGGRFKLEGNKLIVADGSKLDFEAAEYHEVTVRVTDSQGNVTDMTWNVDVTDVEEEQNFIYGNNKANQLKGTTSDDMISGLGGKDSLYGGIGKDVFRFEHVKIGGSNVDHIVDFSVKDDTIELHKNVFGNLKAGDLSKSAFWIGAKAHDKSDRIIYDSAKGNLYYDQDGTGAAKKILFATLDTKPKMTANDFLVIF